MTVTPHVSLYFFASASVFAMLVSSIRVTLNAMTPNVTAKAGEDKVLGCTAHNIPLDPALNSIKWQFGGKPLKTNSGRLVQNEVFTGSFGNFTLAIKNITAADEGIYTCYVFSSGRQGIKVSMSLKVYGETFRSTRGTQLYQPWSEVTQKPSQPVPVGDETAFISSSLPSHTVPREKEHPKSSLLAMWATLGGVTGLGTTAIALYFYTRKKKIGSHNGPSIQNYKEYKYDVFVTYRSKDSEIWVKETLLPLLDENNLKYCVHDIHWEPGRYLNEQMAESVYQSRMVLVLLSKNYMKSSYCKEELHYAIYRNVEKGDRSLIVVKFDNMNVKKIPKEIRNRTFIDTSWNCWKEKLVKALKSYSKIKKETISDV